MNYEIGLGLEFGCIFVMSENYATFIVFVPSILRVRLEESQSFKWRVYFCNTCTMLNSIVNKGEWNLRSLVKRGSVALR